MKKAIYGFIAGVLLATSVNVIAGDITANGMYQGDIFTFLSNVVTMSNEIKTDHNASFGDYSGSANLSNEIKTDYNLTFANYTAAIKTINELKTDYNALFAAHTSLVLAFNNMTGTQIPEITAVTWSSLSATLVAEEDAVSTGTAVTGSDASIGSNIVTTTDLTLTGL